MPDRPGRPPAPPITLDPAVLANLTAQAELMARDPAALKKWLAPKRLFHVLLQDHLAVAPLPGAAGVMQNAQSSRLFLDMTAPLMEALEDVPEPDPDPTDPTPSKESDAKPPRKGRLVLPIKRPRRKLHRQ